MNTNDIKNLSTPYLTFLIQTLVQELSNRTFSSQDEISELNLFNKIIEAELPDNIKHIQLDEMIDSFLNSELPEYVKDDQEMLAQIIETDRKKGEQNQTKLREQIEWFDKLLYPDSLAEANKRAEIIADQMIAADPKHPTV